MKTKSKYSLRFFVAVSACAVLLLSYQSCKKDDKLPDNPYDSINRDTTDYNIPIDSLNITYVHNKVLQSKCALPGCHDGNFEPDFRSVQSSFSNLVYAPVFKNNAQNEFTYRVIPYDTTNSVLYERITNCCFVNNNDRMPQDNIGQKLPDADIELVAKWIMSGARDIFGNIPQFPNSQPTIQGYLGVSSDFQTVYSNTRLDSVYYNPFVLPASVNSFYIGVAVVDDSTPVNQLQFNKLKISTNADNFNGANTYTATYFSAGGQSAWIANVNASALPLGDTLFMRYFVNDGDHAQNTEFPRNELPFAYKTFWSFIRQ